MIMLAPPPQIVCSQQEEAEVGDYEKFCEAMNEAIANAPDEATVNMLRGILDSSKFSNTADSGGHGGTIPPPKKD